MSKKFKSQASSARAASGYGGFGGFATATSPLSYIAEQPDLSQISDAGIVVAFKNLTKKDSTTKSKALDELLASAESHAEPAVFTAWSELYPRVSIDNSQIVRRNAHVLQGIYTVKAGKKIAPLLPKLVPSWLAGAVDNDKSVAKAASEALERAFPTQDKRSALWKLYKDAICERIDDALLVQTTGTLSDERVTSLDEAQLKYVRVVGTALYLLNQLLASDLERTEILQEKKLWDFVHHEDSYIRSAVCGLVITVLSREEYSQSLDWTIISTAFLYKALNKSQIGSSSIYAKSLCKLTEVRPTIWTSDYTAKTQASKRLLSYLQSGSEGGPLDVWPLRLRLLKLIPNAVWKKSDEDVTSLADAYRTGVSKERLHIETAWRTYVNLCFWLSKDTSITGNRFEFLERQLLPLIMNFVNKSDSETWRIGIRAEGIATAALAALQSESLDLQTKLWTNLSDTLIERMRLSLPESSKDFKTSQDAVAAHGLRYTKLQKESGRSSATEAPNRAVLYAALELLRSRNGKPFGAASVAQAIVATGGQLEDEKLRSFLKHDLPDLLLTPASDQLVMLALTAKEPLAQTLLDAPISMHSICAMNQFVRSASAEELETAHVKLLQRVGNFESKESRTIATLLLMNRGLPAQLQSDIIRHLLEVLQNTDSCSDGLYLLENAATTSLLSQLFTSPDYGQQLASRLLIIGDSQNGDLAERANAISANLASTTNISSSTIPTIRKQLSGEADMLSILTLTDLGLKCRETVPLTELLPDVHDWQQALEPHLTSSPPTSLSITSPLRGSVWMVSTTGTRNMTVKRDTEEFSLLFRLVFYVTRLLKAAPDDLSSTAGPRHSAIHYYYPLALQLVNEKLTLDSSNTIWLGSTEEVINAAADTLSDGWHLVPLMQNDEGFVKHWNERFNQIGGTSRLSYYQAITWVSVISKRMSVEPRAILAQYNDELQSVRQNTQPMKKAALFALVGESFLETQGGLKTVNELIATITAAPTSFQETVSLNILLGASHEVLAKVPQQRLVFLFQKLVNFLREEADGANVLTEGFVLAARIIPYVRDIYGEHWTILLDALLDIWEFLAADDIALLHSSLSVYDQLRKSLAADDVNDDLVEAMQEKRDAVSPGLLQSLKALSKESETRDQPREIAAELLRRQLVDVNVGMGEMAELFTLLDCKMTTIQTTAYGLLHKAIPKQQEMRSIELALGDAEYSLPEELLIQVSLNTQPETYALGWKLIFDHYQNASHNLRESYTANLKQGGQIGLLLDFVCEQIRITSGRPIDPAKFEIDQWDLRDSGIDEQGMQYLCVHLFYLSLFHVSSLVKDWFLQQKNRVKIPLENWTEKHITPLILASSLALVKDWAASQSTDSNNRVIEIKSSPRAQELTASIPVDPESPPISLSINFPGAYPLISPVVNARTRVGVSEKNFTAWLRTIQIIVFSTGSIIEGLVAFRKNVQGELTGQTECAICYSIIGTDMQTPNKKCGTCKNMFHGVCLFKWFKSSNSSSCPLCRNNFNYA